MDGSPQDAGNREPADPWELMVSNYGETLAADEAARRRIAEGPGGIDVDSPWVKIMGWSKHFDGRDLNVVYRASVGPLTEAQRVKLWSRAEREEQGKLARLAESFERQVARGVARLDRVPVDTLKWLASIDPSKPRGRPFGLKDVASSMTRYKTYWKRYLCYCVRVFRAGRDASADTHGVRFTDEQWSQLGVIVQQLDNDNDDDDGDAPIEASQADRGSPAGSAQVGENGGTSWPTAGCDDEDLAGIFGDMDMGERQHEDEYMSEDEYEIEEVTEHTADEEAVDEADAVLDRHVFLFCISSMKQKVLCDVYINPLLHFCAVLGIDGEMLSYRGAIGYTGQLAGLMWSGRLLMLEHVFEDQPEDPNEMTIEAVKHFEDVYRLWLAEGSYSPFSNIIRWMSYGRGYREKEPGMARLMWEEQGVTMRWLGHRITVDDLRSAAQLVVRNAEELLDGLFCGRWAEARDSIRMRDISDSLRYDGPGRSFATDVRNNWLRPGHERLSDPVRDLLWDSAAGRWRRSNAAEYMSRLRSFKRALLVSTHIWGGQPGRGPEIMTMQHADTQQLVRNVFVFDGQVMLITDRDKNKAIRGTGRKVARFLPDDIGRMMVAYITWVIPFERMLSNVMRPGSGGGESAKPAKQYYWLWTDGRNGRWETDVLSRELGMLTGEHVGVELKTADYRHVAIELGRQVQGLVVRQIEAGIGEDGDGDDEEWDPLTGETRPRQRVELVFDLQSTHGSKIARQHYALHIDFPDQLTPQMVMVYREISSLWHQYLRAGRGASLSSSSSWVSSSASSSVASRGRRRKAKSVAEQKDGKRLATVVETAETGLIIDTGLRTLFGPEAGWRSQTQRDVMGRMMALGRGNSLIAVLPTGGGKSIFFMLPAALERHGVHVVVVPFVALMDDLVRRACDFGIDCVGWKSSRQTGRDEPLPDASLVVVSADSVTSDEFTAYLDALRARKRLRRIFVDECHTIIMDVGYRERLAALKGLHRFDAPLVLLTATLPVRLERWFRRQMLVEDAEIVRSPTTKLNIRYTVKTVEAGRSAVDQEVVRTVVRLENTMRGEHKGVVYCRTKKRCEAVAGKLGCDYYHSGIAEPGRRAEVLSRWAEGRAESRWIAATTGLGTGVDIPGIVAIVHMEQPYGLVDFVQQTGRGGRRDGEVVESVIVTDGKPVKHDEQSSDVEHMNRQAMERFINDVDCRRVGLGLFMDGQARDCEEMDGERCDRCRDRVESNPLGEDTRSRCREVGALRQWLQDIEGKCGVCFIRWHHHGRVEERRHRFDHPPNDCRIVPLTEFRAWKRKVRFRDYSCCWVCGLPLEWCAEAKSDRGTGEQGDCAWPDQVLRVVVMARQSHHMAAMVRDEFDVDVADEGYAAWAGRDRSMYDETWTNALAVWVLIVSEFCMIAE